MNSVKTVLLFFLFCAINLCAGYLPRDPAVSVQYPFQNPKPFGKYQINKEQLLEMDGKTAGITFPADKLHNPEKGMTIIAVFKYTELPGVTDDDKNYNALAYRHRQFSFGFNRNRIDVQFFRNKGGSARICLGANYADGDFHIAAFTVYRHKEPTQGMDFLNVKVYFDGRLVSQEHFHNFEIADPGTRLNIGHADGFGKVWHWNGAIASVYAYNRVLNQDEIEKFTASSRYLKIVSGVEKLSRSDRDLLASLPKKSPAQAAAVSALETLAIRNSRIDWRGAAKSFKASGKLPEALKQYVLDRGILTVAKSADQAFAVSLYDTVNRREVLHPENPFFRVHLPNGIFTPLSGEKRSVFKEISKDHFRITSFFPGFITESDYIIKDGKLSFFVKVPGKVNLVKMDYPLLKINKLDKGAVLFTPEMSGVAHPEAAERSIGYEADYPRGVASMQYGLFYDKRGGIFWSTADPDGRGKKIAFSAGRSGVTALYSWFPPRNEGFTPCKNGARIELFQGDWYEGAMIYRKLMREIKAAWFSTASLPRKDTPAWARENLFSTRLSFKYTPPEAMLRVAEYMKIPMTVQLGMWFCGFYDRDYPNFRAQPEFTAYVAKLRSMGIRVIPYANGRLWELRDRRDEDWRFTKEAKPNCIIGPDGKLVINNFAVDFAIMCPATRLFEETTLKYVREMIAWGSDAIYIDQIGAAYQMPCYDPNHGHKVPDDTMFFKNGHNVVFPKVRRMMRSISADAAITTEDNSEVCVKNFDLLLPWRWCYEHQVPAFSVIYSGRVQLYGMQERDMNPGSFDSSAWQFICGAQLSAGQLSSFVKPELHEFRLWTKQLTRLRHAMLDFFNAGIMRRPVEFVHPVEMRRQLWGNFGTKYVTSPQIRNTSWQLGQARAVAILNQSPKTQKNAFIPEKDFPAGKLYCFSSRGTEKVIDYTPGQKIEIDLPPRSFQLYLHVPANDDGDVLLERVRSDFHAINTFNTEEDPFLTDTRKSMAVINPDSGIAAIDTGLFEFRFFPGALYPDNFRKTDGPQRLNIPWKFVEPFDNDNIVIGKERFQSRFERWAEHKILLNTKDRFVIETRGTLCTFSKNDAVLPGNAQLYYKWEFAKKSPVVKVRVELTHPGNWKNAAALLLNLRRGTLFEEKSRIVRNTPQKLIIDAVFHYTGKANNVQQKPVKLDNESSKNSSVSSADRAFHAAREMKKLSLPRIITLNNGTIEVLLDSHKFWNLNRVDMIVGKEKRNFGIENSESHYGMVLRPAGSQFFIGSGHCESGKSEIVTSLKIYADGKEIKPGQIPIKGSCIKVEKVSTLASLQVKYYMTMQGNRISEKVELFSPEKVDTRCIYLFMHPWNTRFTKMSVIDSANRIKEVTAASDNSHPFGTRTFYPLAMWQDNVNGDVIITRLTRTPGSPKTIRYIWDRKGYRKNYMVDYVNSFIPANTRVTYNSETIFLNRKGKKISMQEAAKLCP